MVETITPAGCGSRHRRRVALALFSVGAIAAAAALEALLGLVGAQIDRSWTVPALAVLAVLAALREWGGLRVLVPGAHRQVPERWRREWPLGAWSLAYGAGLGAGIFTNQVVATFWVACAGAVAIGDPAWSAACLALFGAGRALMVALPARGGRDPSLAVGRLARRARGGIVVWHQLHPLQQNLLPLQNLPRRQLRRQNLRHLGPRQDRCHLLARQRLVVGVAGAERSRSRHLPLLQGTDVPVASWLFLPR